MSNVRIGNVKVLVLPTFSDIYIGKFYAIQGLDGFRLKIDDHYFYDLQLKMRGVEEENRIVNPYKVCLKIEKECYHHLIAFHEIEIGSILEYDISFGINLAMKISDDMLFDIKSGKTIEVSDKKREFNVPIDVCIDFIADLENANKLNERKDEFIMNQNDLMTAEQLQRLLDRNPEYADQMICYAIARKRKEGKLMSKETCTTTAKFTFETDNPDELKRILDHHLDYLVDFDDNRDIVKSISVSDIHCNKIVTYSNGQTNDGNPCNDPEGKPTVPEKVKKERVTELSIIMELIRDKPYYEVKYRNVGDSFYKIGYSSYNLKTVLGFINDYFEIVKSDEQTNAE